MTINQLIKNLQAIQEKHGKRLPVCIDMVGAKKYQHDEMYSHIDVPSVAVEVISWAKDDNFERADGTERTKKVVTLCQR